MAFCALPGRHSLQSCRAGHGATRSHRSRAGLFRGCGDQPDVRGHGPADPDAGSGDAAVDERCTAPSRPAQGRVGAHAAVLCGGVFRLRGLRRREHGGVHAPPAPAAGARLSREGHAVFLRHAGGTAGLRLAPERQEITYGGHACARETAARRARADHAGGERRLQRSQRGRTHAAARSAVLRVPPRKRRRMPERPRRHRLTRWPAALR